MTHTVRNCTMPSASIRLLVAVGVHHISGPVVSSVPFWKSVSRIAAMAKWLLANSSLSFCWRNTRIGLTVLKALI